MDSGNDLFTASLLILLLGKVLMIVQAVRVDAVWGFVVLIVPFAPLLFVMLHWRKARVPLCFWLGGFVAMIASVYGDAAQVTVLLMIVGAAAWLMVQEYQQTGTVLYGPKNETEPDLDSEERPQDSTNRDD